MGDLSNIALVDGTDYPLAEYLNELFAGLLRAEHSNTQTISGTLELDDGDYWLQVISPSGANRTVELSAEAVGNHITVIYNAGATYSILVKDDSGATTFVTLAPDEWAVFLPVSGERWIMVRYSGVLTGSSYLTSDFNITGATTVFQDTGLSVTLPEAGTYLVQANVRCRVVMASGTYGTIETKLHNSTDAADVSNSLRRCVYTTSTAQIQVTNPITAIITVTASKVIKLYAARTFDGSLTNSDIAGSATTGLTSLTYVKIGEG